MAERRVSLAVLAYAFLVPFQPVFDLPDGSPLRIAGAELVAPFVLLEALARPKRRLPVGELGVLLVSVPILAAFSTLVAAGDRSLSGYAIGKTAGLFYLVALALALVRVVPRGGEVLVLRALGRGILVSAIVGLVGFVAWAVAGIESPLVEFDRLCSTMPGDPNIYCSLLAVALPITLSDTSQSVVRRAVAVTILGLALLASGSRSGLVGALVAVAVWAMGQSRDRWATVARGVFLLLGTGTVVGGLSLLTSGGATVATTLWDHLWRLSTIESRFDLYDRAFELFMEHPLLGLGIGGFNDLNTFASVAGGELGHYAVHNTYLWAFVDLGVGGGILLPTVIAAGVLAARQSARRNPDCLPTAAVVIGGLVAMAVFNLFVDGFYQRHFWILLGCALGMPAARRLGSPVAAPTMACARNA